MTFIEPAVEEIYDVLSNNDELIKYLKENEYLLTRSMLYDSYTVEQIKEMETAIYANNVETLYNLAKVLLDNSEEIKSHDVWYLTSNLIAFEDIAGSFGLDRNTFSIEAYQLIIYTYKFCYVSSFFQNNKETFFTEYDFNEIENTPILKSFVDALMKEFDKLDCIIGKCIEYHDFDEVPYDLINYLTQLLGFEKANISADDTIEKKYREIARNIIDVYRIKGTNYSFELLFKFLGYNIEVKEFYFDRRYYYSINGNTNTNTTDNTSSLYYMSIYPPHDNKLDITNNEIVGLFDYTTQYNLDEFSMLADKYGPEAVLGYSRVDKNGNEYEGKIYKYFKSNLVYYTVGLDKENPNEKQLFQINKILSFLTPAYIMKTTNINVYTGSNSNSPSDNMIFFDDNRSINNTLEDLEEGVTTEEGFEAIREKVRDLYPIMLDSEMRDDMPIPKRTNADLYVDEDGNILHDDTSKSPYINTINTTTFKPKVPFIINGKICLNKYARNKYFDFITIKNDVKNNDFYENVIYTDLTIEDYLNNQELSYAKSFINTLTLLESAPKTDDNIKDLKIKYNVCLDVEKNFATLPNFIAPITLGKENLIRMVPTKCVLVISGNTVGVYKFGAVPSCNSRYTESFDIKLIKTQVLYRSVNKKITINVGLKEEKLNLDALYDAAKAKPNAEALKYYYYNASENSWYYPIRKAKLTSKIISVSGKTKYLMASTVLPISDDMAAEYCIPKVFKVEGKYGYNVNTATYDTPEEYFEDNGIEIYNNFSFYIQDEDEPYESDLYTFYVSNNTNPYEISSRLVYSSLDEKLYRISQYNYEELPDFFGRLEIDGNSAKLYEYDESWYGYNEVDDKDNFIRYNNEHRIIWTYIDYDKVIGRPIKTLTDKEVTPELKELLLSEIYHSTYDYFSPTDKRALLAAGGYSYEVEFYEDIKNGIINPDVVTFLGNKRLPGDEDHPEFHPPVPPSKDVYGNYNDNFKLLYDFLNSGDLDEFIKWYYYDKLTKLYREAIFLDEITEFAFNEAEKERKPLFETLNGNMGILGKPNTLLQSRKKTSSININYSVVDNSTINVSKNDLLKSGLLIYNNNKPYLQEIRNIRLCYGTKNKLIKNFEIEITANNYNITSEEFPEDLRNGYLEVNNTPQLLSDNKINEHTSELLEKEEFVTLGDDRRLDIYEKVEENCKAILNEGEILILLPKGNYSDVYSVEIDFPDDKRETFFDKIFGRTIINIKNPMNTFNNVIDFKDVESNCTVNISNLRIIEK